MGAVTSKSARLDKALGLQFPEHERLYGLENFGNTCYANSVLQALYYCRPLRERCIAHWLRGRAGEEDREEEGGGATGGEGDLLEALCELFHAISTQKRRCGVYAPRRFIEKLRGVNEIFNNQMHQDAHELLNYLLNEMAEILEKRNKRAAEQVAGGKGCSGSGDRPTGDVATGDEAGSVEGDKGGSAADDVPGVAEAADKAQSKTWIHSIFEGLLTNETRCLACDSVTSRDESFLDLSLEIEQNSSVSACMRNFSANESLRGDNKFYCDSCCSLQEAHKRMRIKQLPNVLALHLKRFKYIEPLQRFKKLSYRIAFPMELKLTNVVETATDPDRKYKLFAVVVHAGSGINHGHYVALVRSHSHWICFDDDVADLLDEQQLPSFFGTSLETAASTETGYLLFYQADSWDGSSDPSETGPVVPQSSAPESVAASVPVAPPIMPLNEAT